MTPQERYRLKHPEQYAAYSLKYYYANKEKAAERNKLWRAKNKELVLEKQRLKKRERKQWAVEYLGGKCVRCQQVVHDAAFEFHHRNPEEKDRDPSKMLQLSLARLKNELDKCDLLCANCHRVVHWEWRNAT